MSPRDWRVRIEDILESIDRIGSFVAGMAYQQFIADQKTVRACAYEVGVIGEAAQRIPDQVKKQHTQIPWDKMQAMRNVVFHEYFRVGLDILWETITKDLPPVAAELQKILSGAQRPE